MADAELTSSKLYPVTYFYCPSAIKGIWFIIHHWTALPCAVCLRALALTSRTSSVWSEVRMLTVTFCPFERQMSRATSSVGICCVSCRKDAAVKHNMMLPCPALWVCNMPSEVDECKAMCCAKKKKEHSWGEENRHPSSPPIYYLYLRR